MATWRRIALEKLAAYPALTHELAKTDPVKFMIEILPTFAQRAKKENDRDALLAVYEYVVWAETECKSLAVKVMASTEFYTTLFRDNQPRSYDSPTVLDFFGIQRQSE